MSVFNQATAACGKCGTENAVNLASSVNAGRRPDLRVAILDGSFQAMKCTNCGTAVRLPAHLTYLDMDRNQWFLVGGYDALADWRTAETEAQETYDLSFGVDAPVEAQEIGAGLLPRLVFGWPALREKLIAGDLGLDDRILELLKMEVIASVPAPPAADGTELRLTGGDDTTLNLAWIVSNSEQTIARVNVPRHAYTDIEDEPDDWVLLRAEFDGHLFVDLKRLTSGSGVAQAAAEVPAGP